MSDKKTAVEQKEKAQMTMYLQFRGKEVAIDDVIAAIRENYDEVKKGEDKPQDVKVYLKPEDARAYYVINDDYAGDVVMPFE